MNDWAKDAERWITADSGKSLRDMLERFTRNSEAGTGIASGFTRRATGLTQYLPRFSDYMPRNITGQLPRVSLPTPRLGSLPTPRSAADAGKAVLLVAVLVALAFCLWRAAGWYVERRARLAAEWRPGPWPFAPQSVSTREQLVRAFDHLASASCLEPRKRTLNHREVTPVKPRQAGC